VPLNADPLCHTTNSEHARNPLNRRINRILWLLGTAFVLHELEEWNIVAWQQANFEPPPQFTDREARTLLILFAFLGFSFTAMCNWLLSFRKALVVLLPLFVAIILGNALTHIFWLFYFEAYAPGVVTSVLLLVPLTVLLVHGVLREHLVATPYVWTLVAMAALQPVSAAIAGGTLSGPQLALQRFGAQLARCLWGAA
jgi:hypothetical protein